MRIARWIIALGLVAAPAATATADPTASHLYWTSTGASRTLSCIALETPPPAGGTILVDPLAQPRDVAVDLAHGRIYWADPGAGRIQRADLDGANVEDVLTGLPNPRSLALDPEADVLYWTDPWDGTVSRAGLDGSDPAALVTGLVLPFGLAIDRAAGKLYWTQAGTGVIQASALDGSGVADVLTGLGGPRYLALDPLDGEIFWTQMSPAALMRASADGGDATAIGSVPPFSGDIALDAQSDAVYWADGLETIWRARQDGSETVAFLTGLEGPVGLALAPSPASVPALGSPARGVAILLLVASAFAAIRTRCWPGGPRSAQACSPP